MESSKSGNPAVVGLAGFGMTTLVLQFHNVGWMSIGPVIWLGLIFGGLAQMIAGFGSFWLSLALQLIGNHYNLYASSSIDIGWFLVGWTLFTAILWIPSMR